MNFLSISSTILTRWPLFEGLKVLWARIWSKYPLNTSKQLLTEDNKYSAIESFHYKLYSKKNRVLVCKANWNLKGVFLRRFSSDYDVFEQIFLKEELKGLLQLIEASRINVIIDAGANIGLSSLKFHSAYPGANIIAIEPDKKNYELLVENLEFNQVKAVPIKSAIWNKTTSLYFDRTFGDGREWAVSVTDIPNEGEYISSLSINDIVKKYNLEQIDILKIDVEGSEKAIFQFDDESISFLAITKFIAIELHEETEVSGDITKLLTSRGFILSKSGEYVIGKNVNISE